MSGQFRLLADFDLGRDLLDTTTKGTGLSNMDTLIILGFIILLAVALFFWAYFIRKRPTENLSAHALVKPKKQHRSRRSSRSSSGSGSDTELSARGERVKRRRRRRREGNQIRRNPTLEESGGLPPIRSDADGDDSNPPSSSASASPSTPSPSPSS